MFKDYYKILGIPTSATPDEIRSAYRYLCKQWHPDINTDADATAKMQDINEAYLILKDPIKRQRYDEEYARFKAYEQRKGRESREESQTNNNQAEQHKTSSSQHRSYQRYRYYEYDIKDDFVRRDVDEARKKAEDYINELINSLKDSSRKAAKGALEGCLPYLIVGIIGSIIMFIVFTLY